MTLSCLALQIPTDVPDLDLRDTDSGPRDAPPRPEDADFWTRDANSYPRDAPPHPNPTAKGWHGVVSP